jgi:glycosyltransferase involved in cell wall biosynthesis
VTWYSEIWLSKERRGTRIEAARSLGVAISDFIRGQGATRRQVSDSISKDDVTIVLPVLNEEAALSKVLSELIAEGYNKILVVDGYSSDLSLEVAQEFGVQSIQQNGRGKTGALRTALEHVNTPYILLMDADYTYDPKDIKKFLVHAKHYDEIIGARRKNNGSISPSHRFGNRFITGVFNFLFSTRLSDVLSGMYLLKTETARELDLFTTGFSVEVEIAAQVVGRGSITEVPVAYRKRIGKQKLSTWKDGPRILSATVKLARLHNPAFFLSLIAGLTAIPGIGILLYEMYEQLMSRTLNVGLTFLGVLLVLFGSQALAAGTVAILMKRMEARISRQIRKASSPLQSEKTVAAYEKSCA